jgi:DNA-directed RNA polymerase specialized sigma24 family protein
MPDRHDYEALFVEHLPFIERSIAAVIRVLSLRDDDAEEFGSWAKERVLEHDYLLVRKWRGESLLTTYLATVITNLGREFRVKRWGRWRPSAAARRGGPLAVRLETLVHRDGMRVDEAAEYLRTRDGLTIGDREVAEIVAALPRRTRARRVDEREVPIESIADDEDAADASVALEEDAADRERVYRLLREAIGALPSLDVVILTMHIVAGRSLADVARALNIPQRPLYRVRDGLLARLFATLSAQGVTRERVRAFIGAPLLDAEPDDIAGENGDVRPSMTRTDSAPSSDADRPTAAADPERLTT